MLGPFPKDAKAFSLGSGASLNLVTLLCQPSYISKVGFLPVHFRNLKANCFSPKVTIAKFWQGKIQ